MLLAKRSRAAASVLGWRRHDGRALAGFPGRFFNDVTWVNQMSNSTGGASPKAKGPAITWEDDDASFGHERQLAEPAGEAPDSFAALLAGKKDHGQRLMVGEKVKGTVSFIPPQGGDVLVDLGGKSSGLIEKLELIDESGQLKVKVGDPIEAFVLSKKGGEVLLSYKMSQQLRSAADLEAAQSKGIPVRGKVLKLVKGGFEVAILGKTAFCPLSQMDVRFSETGAEHLGKDYEFLVEKVEERGRNIVLSRAAWLRREAEAKAKELLATLTPELVLSGKVTQLRDFGAFVDLGGVEGLVHVSEMAHGRVSRPQDVVQVGETVAVKVLKIDRDPQGRPKISLSMKAALENPWDRISDHVTTSKSYQGRVVSLQSFGAFVEIRPGIEGLIHVSEMSWTKRIHHPSEVLKVGDPVTVLIKDIDPVHRRLSLSMKQAEDDPWYDVARRFPVGGVAKAKVERLKPFGVIAELAPGVTGMVPMGVIKRLFGEAYRQPCTPGRELEVRVVNLDIDQRKILLSLADVEEEEADRRDYVEYLKAQAEDQHRAQAEAPAAASKTGSFGALLSAKLKSKS